MNLSLMPLLKMAREQGASDIHLVHRLPPALRVGTEIRMTKGAPLSSEDLHELFVNSTTEHQRGVFEREWQLCFSRSWEEIGRCRISVYLHMGVPELAIRLTETSIRGREQLNLPPVLDDLIRKGSGLLLITGPTGSGKTTTLNYLIDRINRERRAKIITIEDPVEYEHHNINSIVVQQEVHTDTPSFGKALIHVLRQDPDVIVVGEARDRETISTAMQAAETGHLVIATLHTPDVVQTVQRLASAFNGDEQPMVLTQLANSLLGIVTQTLLPTADGTSQVLGCEVCVSNVAIRKFIRDNEAFHIYSEMQSGRRHHMQTMDSVLIDYYKRGLISYDTAVSKAKDPDNIRK